MTQWAARPPEIAYLLNPAFIGVILERITSGFWVETSERLPFSLTFIAVPIVMHAPTRESLPGTVATHMNAWLERTPEARIGFAARVRNLAPYVREAAIAAIAAGLLTVDAAGLGVGSVPTGRKMLSVDWAQDANDCLKRATFVGRWLGHAGTSATIYTVWGIRP